MQRPHGNRTVAVGASRAQKNLARKLRIRNAASATKLYLLHTALEVKRTALIIQTDTFEKCFRNTFTYEIVIYNSRHGITAAVRRRHSRRRTI